MKLRFTFLTLMVAFVFVLAACSSDDDDDAPVVAATAVPSQPAAATAVPAAQAQPTAVPAAQAQPTAVPAAQAAVPAAQAMMTYNEAPALAALAAAGTIPAVADRLPDEPMVMPMNGPIGKYGGTIRRFYLGPSDACNFFRMSRASFSRYSTDGFSYIPSLAKGWESSDDGKEWTIFMRKGVKWSDGEEFNVDDVMYQYEQVILNQTLTPGTRLTGDLRIGLDEEGNPFLATIEKIDDYSFKVVYPLPNFLFLDTLSQGDQDCGRTDRNSFWDPEHYMKQFHIDFNPDADADAKAAGFEDWTQLYDNKTAYVTNAEKPTLAPWKYENELGASLVTANRNPYYWGVDPEGNQLPYVDTLTFILVDNPTVGTLKAIQGEIDMQGRHIRLPDFTVLKEGEEKGGYHVVLWPAFGGTDATLRTNQAFQGPTGEALRNPEFRRAMSIAIDRDSINEVSFLGLATPRNSVPVKGHAQYPGEEYEFKDIYYAPAEAIEILDRIYPDKDSEGWRLLPGGERINMLIANSEIFLPYPDIAEQVVADWRDVGVFSVSETLTRSIAFTKIRNNEFPVWLFSDSGGFGYQRAQGGTGGVGSRSNPGWGVWTGTDGAEGIEPPQIAKDNQVKKSNAATLPEAERNEIGKQYYKDLIDLTWEIHLVGLSPASQGVNVINNDLMNVPETNMANLWAFRTPNGAYPEQVWYDR